MDLNQRIRSIQKLLERSIPKMICIRLDLAEDLEMTNADPGQIEQVIINLALNARDAMEGKGSLLLRTENVKLDDEYCRLNVEARPGDYVLLTVSDTGRGMDGETLQHIFEPFYTTKEIGRGTGLGLAMVYGIVKQHGGHITCQSEIGNGATFRIYLPAISGERKFAVELTTENEPEGTGTILLVDDEAPIRELGKRILTRNGYTVLTAIDGANALNIYERERERICLVVVDLMMPNLGGKDCMKRILEIDPEAKILVATGYAADGSTKECLDLGAIGVITKPLESMNSSVKCARLWSDFY